VLLAGFKPDASVHDLATSVDAVAGPKHPALGGSHGHRIGLSVYEGKALHADAIGRIASQTVYALRVGTIDAESGGAFASAMAWIDTRGAVRVLSRNDPE
jgi:hypothetical protein